MLTSIRNCAVGRCVHAYYFVDRSEQLAMIVLMAGSRLDHTWTMYYFLETDASHFFFFRVNDNTGQKEKGIS